MQQEASQDRGENLRQLIGLQARLLALGENMEGFGATNHRLLQKLLSVPGADKAISTCQDAESFFNAAVAALALSEGGDTLNAEANAEVAMRRIQHYESIAALMQQMTAYRTMS